MTITATPGTSLPEMKIHADPTFVVTTAIATRDFQPVHHDRDIAVGQGSKDIFVNILTVTGLVERFVTDWGGPGVVMKKLGLRLGVPWYAYDTTIFTGEVASVDDDGLVTIDIKGRNSLGDHVTATVTCTMGAQS